MSLYVLSYMSIYICLYIYIYIYSPICPLYIYTVSYLSSPLYIYPADRSWAVARTTQDNSQLLIQLVVELQTSLASSCNWSCNQVYSHNKSCQWSGEVVQLSYDRRILRSATTMKDHQRLVPRPSHDRRTTTDDYAATGCDYFSRSQVVAHDQQPLCD